MLARSGGENSGQRFAPQTQEIQRTSALLNVAALLLEDHFHLSAVVRAEIEGHHAKQRSEHALRKRGLACFHAVRPWQKNALRQFGFLKEFHGTSLVERQLHALGFGKGNFPAKLRETIVAAAFVVETEGRTLVRFRDPARAFQSRQIAIQGAGAKTYSVISPAKNFFNDGVAMFFAIGQRQQNVKHRRSERRKRCCRLFLRCHISLFQPQSRSVSASVALYRVTA